MSNYTNSHGSSGLQNLPPKKRSRRDDSPVSGLLDLSGHQEDDFLSEIGEGVDPIVAAVAPRPRRRTPTGRGKSPGGLKNAQKTKKKAAPARRAPMQLHRKSKSHDLKATAAPLLATVGLLLLVPAVWSLLLLGGVAVPGSEREDSRPMAAIMLVSWPIAICLIGVSVLFFKQVMQEKKRLIKAKSSPVGSA